jgi:uncharacterized protein
LKAVHRVLDPNVLDPSTSGLCALAVMTKVPLPGQVKTRLVPPLTPEQAAQINICFLRDTATAIAHAAGEIAREIAVYTPVGAESAYGDILPLSFNLVAQRGDGFGERLACAAEDLFRIGFQSICLIDSDSPTVSAEVYAKAAHLLSRKGDRVVLGPSDDGGYYLIGLKKNHRRLFERIDWSTERVFEQTGERAKELDLSVELLPAGYDVDDRSSLRRLCDELFGDNARAENEAAPHTRKFLSELIVQHTL